MADGGETSNRVTAKSAVLDQGARRSPCGYCKSSGDSSVSHGLWAFDLTVDDYQELLDRGWRRSGCFLYKPDMEKTCCPSYTIRLKAGDFVPSKEQARVQKKMRRFLDGKIELEGVNKTHVKMNLQSQKIVRSQSYNLSPGVDVSGSQIKQDIELHQEDRCICYLSDKINDAVNVYIESLEIPSNIQLPKAIVKKVNNQVRKKLVDASEDLVYASSVSFQIVAELRRSNTKLASNASQDGHHMNLSPNIIAEKLSSCINQPGELSGFSVKACNGHLNFYSSLGHLDSEEELASKGGHRNHSKVTGDSKHDQKHHESSVEIHKGHRLDIRMKRSGFDPKEYALYRKYQIRVHNDRPENVTESSYKRFLVDTPLVFRSAQSSSREIPSCGFGSFHQQYLIDGKLIAVGVIDILPRCLSSKYLFWDPDYAFLSLGKYSALMEINWVTKAEVNCPSLQYYYLGYYIHSCSKMRYKASYHPSELLCPLRYQWVPFHIVKHFLDGNPYVILSDFATARNIASSLQLPLNSTVEPPHNDSDAEDSVEYPSNGYQEMELDFESEFSLSGELDLETGMESLNDGIQTGDISKVVLDVNGSHLQFQDLQRVFGPIRKENLKLLELQLRKFVSVVGDKLSGRIVYSLG